MRDLDAAAVITAAIHNGWRPRPAVADGVNTADLLAQGDPYGATWTVSEPRALVRDSDRPALVMAAQAATTFLNTRDHG